jgi:hypothetical protein
MPQFVVEREIPGAGDMTPRELEAAAQRSNAVLERLGPEIRWRQSYVAGDRIYCIYDAPSDELIREHARQSGFPANQIVPVAAVIGPATGSPG